MANMTYTYETRTDPNGYFSITKKIDPWPPDWLPDQLVELSARLIEPDGITVHVTVDIDASDGTPFNQEKKIEAASNQEVSLGSWGISMGENILVVHGKTHPSLVNGILKVEVAVRS